MNDRELSGRCATAMVYDPRSVHRFYPVVKRIVDERQPHYFSRGFGLPCARRGATWRTWPQPLRWLPQMIEQRDVSITCARNHRLSNWNGRKNRSEMRWEGSSSSCRRSARARHLLKPGNAAQHWTRVRRRIRDELGYKEVVALEEAIRDDTLAAEKSAGGTVLLSSIMRRRMRGSRPPASA